MGLRFARADRSRTLASLAHQGADLHLVETTAPWAAQPPARAGLPPAQSCPARDQHRAPGLCSASLSICVVVGQRNYWLQTSYLCCEVSLGTERFSCGFRSWKKKNIQTTFLSAVPIETKLLAVMLLQWFFMLVINQTISASFLLATTSDSC